MISYPQQGVAIATNLFPLILLALSFGLLIVLQAIMLDALSVQSRRLHEVARHLRELSGGVRRQAQAIEQTSQENLVPDRNIIERESEIVHSRDDSSDSQEKFATVREVTLTQANKEKCRGDERMDEEDYGKEHGQAA